MKLLLDTHIALWAITDDPRLPQVARDLIMSSSNEISISVASLWEISIKHGLGRGNMPISGAEALRYFQNAGYGVVPVSATHAVHVEKLPSIHADPFDRLLVAQAQCEPMRLLTHDAILAGYGELVSVV